MRSNFIWSFSRDSTLSSIVAVLFFLRCCWCCLDDFTPKSKAMLKCFSAFSTNAFPLLSGLGSSVCTSCFCCCRNFWFVEWKNLFRCSLSFESIEALLRVVGLLSAKLRCRNCDSNQNTPIDETAYSATNARTAERKTDRLVRGRRKRWTWLPQIVDIACCFRGGLCVVWVCFGSK